MNKNLKTIVIISIILVIMILGVLGFLLIYTKTDLLKTNKQLFFKYAGQMVSEKTEESKISEYFQKKEQQPYENKGKISVNVSMPEVDEESIKLANQVNITFDGKTDKLNYKSEQNINLNYSENVGFPVSYKRDNDIYGLQSDYIGRRYIAIENNNLKELFEKIGVEDLENIPDKIELQQSATIEFSDEEKEIIKEKYGSILDTQLSDEQFIKNEKGEEVFYTLEMTPEQFKNISKQLLETLKTDDLILSKLNQFLKDNYPSEEISIEEYIQELIEKIEETEITNNIKIVICQKNKIFTKLEIQTENVKIQIDTNEQADTLEYNFNIEVTEDENKAEIYINTTYVGLSNLENVQEYTTLGIKSNVEDEEMSYEYEYQNNVIFSNNISIDSFSDDNCIVLNEQEGEYITNLFSAIGTRIQDVNEMHMEQLGTDINPLIFTNPITTSSYILMENAKQSIERSQNNMKQEEQLLEEYDKNLMNYMDNY